MISPQAEILAIVTKLKVRSIVFIVAGCPSRYQYYYRPKFTARQYGLGTGVLQPYTVSANPSFIDSKRDNGFYVELKAVAVRGAANFFGKKNALAGVLGCGELS